MHNMQIFPSRFHVLIYVFLQVTNPAIDPLREGLVMSLEVNIGKRGNILEVGPQNAAQVCFLHIFLTYIFLRTVVIFCSYNITVFSSFSQFSAQVILSSPVLNEGELDALMKDPHLKPQVLPTFFDIRGGLEGSLEKTLKNLCEAADEAVRNGSQLLVLSDRSEELVRIKIPYNRSVLFVDSVPFSVVLVFI